MIHTLGLGYHHRPDQREPKGALRGDVFIVAHNVTQCMVYTCAAGGARP